MIQQGLYCRDNLIGALFNSDLVLGETSRRRANQQDESYSLSHNHTIGVQVQRIVRQHQSRRMIRAHQEQVQQGRISILVTHKRTYPTGHRRSK